MGRKEGRKEAKGRKESGANAPIEILKRLRIKG
jgi:hypothetical protein